MLTLTLSLLLTHTHTLASQHFLTLAHVKVAAYRGKHEALGILTAFASSADLSIRDSTNRTCFEVGIVLFKQLTRKLYPLPPRPRGKEEGKKKN